MQGVDLSSADVLIEMEPPSSEWIRDKTVCVLKLG